MAFDQNDWANVRTNPNNSTSVATLSGNPSFLAVDGTVDEQMYVTDYEVTFGVVGNYANIIAANAAGAQTVLWNTSGHTGDLRRAKSFVTPLRANCTAIGLGGGAHTMASISGFVVR